MGVLFQFQPINKQATAANVRQFFRRDVEKLEQLAGSSLSDIYHSPSFDGVASHTNYLNNTETQVLKAIDARKELCLIVQAITACTETSRTILISKYINHLPMFRIEQLIGYGSSQTKVKQRTALFEFADHYATYGRDLRVKA